MTSRWKVTTNKKFADSKVSNNPGGKTTMRTIIRAIVAVFAIATGLWAQPGPPVSVSWHFDSMRQITTLTITNNSHKDISAFSIQVATFYNDGTSNLQQSDNDYLPLMASVKAAGHPLTANQGNGAFAPGSEEIMRFTEQKQVENVSTNVSAIVFADGTSDVKDQRTYKNIMARRKGTALGLQKVNELMDSALADSANQHPSATVADQIAKLKAVAKNNLASDNPEAYEVYGYDIALHQLSNVPKTGRKDEEESLRAIIVRHNIRASEMLKGVQQ
jgi:hypothetical protein